MIIKEQAIQISSPLVLLNTFCIPQAALWHLEMNAISYGDNKANSVPFCRTLGCMSSYT